MKYETLILIGFVSFAVSYVLWGVFGPQNPCEMLYGGKATSFNADGSITCEVPLSLLEEARKGQ